jgi:CubicO group peptidase (beta-lactamase class C family)
VGKITIRHLLTMTSGFPPDGGVGTLFVRGMLAKPLAGKPGEAFAWNGTNPDLLSIITTELTKQTAAE